MILFLEKSFFYFFWGALFSLLSFSGKCAEKPFSVVLKGSQVDIDYLKAKAELTMARSIDYCRGHLIPSKVNDWQCNSLQRKFTCRVKFVCKYVRLDYNRRTEVKRLKLNLKEMKKKKSGTTLKLIVDKMTYKKRLAIIRGRKNAVRKISPSKVTSVANREKIVKGDIKREKNVKEDLNRKKIVKKDIKNKRTLKQNIAREKVAKQNKIEEKNKLLTKKNPYKKLIVKKNAAEKARREALELREVEKLDALDNEVNKKEIRKNYKEVKVPPSKKKKVEEEEIDLEEEFAEMDDDKKEQSERSEKIYQTKWLSFSFFIERISDSEGGSIVTLGGGISPYGRWSEKIGWRGNLSGKFIEVANELNELEAFLVMDIGFYLQYYLSESWYLGGALGFQKWNGGGEGTHLTKSLEVGYRFTEHFWGMIDSFIFNYTMVGNESENSEMKLGVNISF